MRTNILRSVALMLCACLSSVAQAQYGGYSASAYNNYGASAVPVHPSLQANNGAGYGQPQQYSYQPAYQYQTVAQHMPAPDAGAHQVPAMVHPVQPPIGVQSHGQVYNQPQAQVHSQPAGQVYSQPVQEHHAIAPASAGCSTCNQTAQPTYTYSQPNVYVQAAAAPTCGGSCGTTYESYGSCGMPACGVSCAPEPTQIKRWFGGANILFLTRDDNYDRPLVFDDANPATTRLTAASAGQDFALGYDVTVGSYLGCGQYAISATWLHIDNGSDEVTSAAPTAGDYRANFRNWDRIYYDLNNNFTHDNYNVANDESIYAYFDRAESFTVRRNSSYYGLELNVTGFGIGGAARAGRPSCGGGQACGGGSCGQACGGSCGGSCGGCNTCCGPPPKGCGGQCGPMIPSCCCKLQMNWTTGFRWFHFEDSFGFSARSERAPAAPVFIDTFSYDVDAENELFGWQFGGQLSYCVGCRTSLYAGVKAGIYANDASLRSRISASNGAVLISDLAHSYPTYANQQVSSSVSDTVLASLAEIDLGIGYRICKCWTVRGGYRLISASGVATAIDNISEDPANLGASNVWADSNLILHGGYVGVNYNW